MKGRGAALILRKIQLSAGMAGEQECHLRALGSHLKAHKVTLSLPTLVLIHMHLVCSQKPPMMDKLLFPHKGISVLISPYFWEGFLWCTASISLPPLSFRH